MRFVHLCFAVAVWCALVCPAAAQTLTVPEPLPTPQVSLMPVLLNPGAKPIHLQAGLWLPSGQAPFPLVIINHGTPRDANDTRRMGPDYFTASRWFLSQGYAVVTPMRRGYGESEGALAENWSRPGATCANPDYYGAGQSAASDILAVLDHMRKQPYVDPSRIILVGHSAGGWGTLAALARLPPVIGAIVFAPGRGSSAPDTVCRPDFLISTARTFGQDAHVPLVWFASENDHFFNPKLARAMFDAFSAKHPGDDTFVAVPAFGGDGHSFINSADGLPLWTPTAQAFLTRLAGH